MPIKSGIAGQIGGKAEVTYGTPVVVDRFWEFRRETINDDILRYHANQIGTGRFPLSARSKSLYRGSRGQVELVVLNKGFGLLLEHAIGQNTITGAGANKTHTIIPDAVALQGKSLTIQKGVPDVTGAGTVRAFTYEGGKVTSWELKSALDQALALVLDLDFENVLTNTALATASYPTAQEMFVFTEGAITLGGVAQSVRSFSIKGNNALHTDRRFMGGVKKEPVANGFATITGQLECEFEDLTRYAAWKAGTILANLILTFTLATVIPTTAVPFSFKITLPAIAYSGNTPQIGGPQVVMNPTPFEVLYDGTNPMITIEIVTSDTTS
jgi:hypothetical protein